MSDEVIPGEHTGFEVTKSFRIAEDIVKEAQEHATANREYENFSHYVRIALIRQNRRHREQAGVKRGIEESLREDNDLVQ